MRKTSDESRGTGLPNYGNEVKDQLFREKVASG
jgi:hypothetical protein